MQVLKRGHTELFRRGPDECFESLVGLTRFCQEQKAKSGDRWLPPRSLKPRPLAYDRLVVDFAEAGSDGAEATHQMNDWSFTQLCQLARVNRDTVNGTRHNVNITRLYKDGDEWKTSTSFGREELPLVAKIADIAHTWIYQHGQESNGDAQHANGESR